jgi:Choline/Carnitine o-acyltransferase
MMIYWYYLLTQYDTKRELFRKAIATQGNYMKDASYGKGIDRHMLGLRCMVKPDEAAKASMFTDPAYIQSMTFRLSTSNMSPGTLFYGGFGPVVPDGYGVNYAIAPDSLKFSMSCKRSAPRTNAYKFRMALERTLKDMFILFPKRSEVWGIGWQERFAKEKKDEAYVAKMRKLSDAIKSTEPQIAARYKKDE